MSIISSLADLFRRSAVPSVESTLSQGGSRERAIENLRNLIGEGVTISNQTIGTALSRIQQAMQRGAAIERGESVPRQFIPIDPTIPIGTEVRYRVAVEVQNFNPLDPENPQRVTKVIPVDSDRQLTRDEIVQTIQPALAILAPSGTGGYRVLSDLVQSQGAEITNVTVVSVYRSPVG